MKRILKFSEWNEMNEASSDEFEDDAREWFNKITKNSDHWKFSKIIKIVKGKPNKTNFTILKNQLEKESPKSGRDELLIFIENIEMNTYKKTFKNLEGPKGAIDELFKLILQAIEY